MREGAEENFLLCGPVPVRLESKNCVLRHEAGFFQGQFELDGISRPMARDAMAVAGWKQS
jgi:hypothetical protein